MAKKQDATIPGWGVAHGRVQYPGADKVERAPRTKTMWTEGVKRERAQQAQQEQQAAQRPATQELPPSEAAPSHMNQRQFSPEVVANMPDTRSSGERGVNPGAFGPQREEEMRHENWRNMQRASGGKSLGQLGINPGAFGR